MPAGNCGKPLERAPKSCHHPPKRSMSCLSCIHHDADYGGMREYAVAEINLAHKLFLEQVHKSHPDMKRDRITIELINVLSKAVKVQTVIFYCLLLDDIWAVGRSSCLSYSYNDPVVFDFFIPAACLANPE